MDAVPDPAALAAMPLERLGAEITSAPASCASPPPPTAPCSCGPAPPGGALVLSALDAVAEELDLEDFVAETDSAGECSAERSLSE